MRRHGVLCYRLMFQSTRSSLIIKLTSSTRIWTQGIGSVCHQYGPGTFMWISFLLYKLVNCLTHREPENGPCFCGAVEVKVSLCSWPTVWIEIRREFLIGYLTSLSCLPPRHWGKSFSFPCEAGNVSELQGLSHRGRRGLSVTSQSPGETQCVIPADQTAFTFQWLSQTICGIGNMY